MDIKTNKITKGQKIDSYKSLCTLLSISTKSGNSKISQMKEVDRYLKYKKVGYGFFIEEIYSTPKTKKDIRIENSLYSKHIEKILLNQCTIVIPSITTGRKSIELSKTGLLLKLNMINSNYSAARGNADKFSRYLKVPIETINDFYSSTTNNSFNIIESVLNRLKNKSLIFWSNIIKIRINGFIRTANGYEVKYILDVERRVLDKLGYSSKKTVFLKNKWSSFSSSVISILKNERGIDYYYSAYEIVCSDDFINLVITEDELNKTKRELNNNCIQGNISYAESRQKKAFSSEINHNSDIHNNRTLESYVEDSSRISYVVIDTLSGINLSEVFKNMDYEEKYTYKDYIVDSAINGCLDDMDFSSESLVLSDII